LHHNNPSKHTSKALYTTKKFPSISSALSTKISAMNVMPHKGIPDSQMRHLFAVGGAPLGKILAI
jgi:hypothetical protein